MDRLRFYDSQVVPAGMNVCISRATVGLVGASGRLRGNRGAVARCNGSWVV